MSDPTSSSPLGSADSSATAEPPTSSEDTQEKTSNPPGETKEQEDSSCRKQKEEEGDSSENKKEDKFPEGEETQKEKPCETEEQEKLPEGEETQKEKPCETEEQEKLPEGEETQKEKPCETEEPEKLPEGEETEEGSSRVEKEENFEREASRDSSRAEDGSRSWPKTQKEKPCETEEQEKLPEGEETQKEKPCETEEQEKLPEGEETQKEKPCETEEPEKLPEGEETEEGSSRVEKEENFEREASRDSSRAGGRKPFLAESASHLSRESSLPSEMSSLRDKETTAGVLSKRESSKGESLTANEEGVTFASHVPFRSYVSTGGVALEGSNDRAVELFSSAVGAPRSARPPSPPPETEERRPPSPPKKSRSGVSPQEQASAPEEASSCVASSTRNANFSPLSSELEVVPPPSQPYTAFSCFLTASLKPPVLYSRSDFIMTASGNRVGRDTLLFGSQNITLAGRSVVSQGVILRGELAPLRFGRYVYLEENVLVHPSVYRSKGQPLHVPMTVGDYVVVGRNSVVRAVAVGSCVEISVNCVVGNRCILKDFCRLLPGTVLPPDTVVPSFTVFAGNPGKMVDELPEGETVLMKLDAIQRYNLFVPAEES
ncbi:UNVERIFIED_CONTAM: dynactin p25, putative [Hammondia hammondi]|eukprot:XP_008883538.1 dynactin p25, putative [Hammondia hammondi]